MGNFHARRRLGLMTAAWAKSGAPLPYDAEVEWILGATTAYIDTGYVPTKDTGYVVDVAGDLLLDVGNEPSIIGVVAPSHAITRYRNEMSFYFRGVKHGVSGVVSSARNVFSMNRNGDGKVYVNDIEKLSLDLSASFATNKRVWLFTANYVYPYNIDRWRVFAAQIYESGILKIDLAPVRFTNENGVSEGAMYDRVSGRLFRNAGTGAFTIGPDK